MAHEAETTTLGLLRRAEGRLVRALSPFSPTTSPSASGQLRGAVRRLGVLSLVLGAVSLFAVVLNVIMAVLLELESVAAAGERSLCHAGVVLLSVGMFWLTRSGLAPRWVLRCGLVYEVLGAWGVVLPNLFQQGFLNDHPGRVTWLCIWITLFPLLVPTSSQKKLATALLAASAMPILLLISVRAGDPPPPLQGVLSTVLPPYICAGIALLTSQFLRQLEARLQAAEELGSYRLIRLLGQGGMGEVWEARHTLLARHAAVKILRTQELASESEAAERVLHRFEQEAETLSRLTSPNTVTVYDYGVSQSGRPYLVLELLEGMNLEELVERHGPMPPPRALHILVQACRSLAEAHAVGLVHRDVKPANLFLCRLGLERDVLKVLDFGLVGRLKEEARRDARLTRDGFTVGTPAFMAPEAIRAEPPDARSDVYSLGCVAYWLLTGRFVFDRETAVDMMADHLQTPALAPSELVSVLPDLDALILRCLEKSPADRPQTIGDLESSLRACMEQLESQWTQATARSWWEEHSGDGGEVQAPDLARARTESWET